MSNANQAVTIQSTADALAQAFGADGRLAEVHNEPSAVPTGDSSPGQLYDPTSQDEYAVHPATQGEGAPEPQQSQQGGPANVPSYRLREANDRARAAEGQVRELSGAVSQMMEQMRQVQAQNAHLMGLVQGAQQAQSQPRAEPKPAPQPIRLPDLIENPTGYAEGLIHSVRNEVQTAISQAMGQVRADMDRVTAQTSGVAAAQRYGADTVRVATYEAKARGMQPYFMSQPDPVGAACEWYLREQTARTYGGDPRTVQSNVARELLADPAFLQQVATVLVQGGQPQGQPRLQAPQQQRQQTVYPPPLASVPRGQQAFPAQPPVNTRDALRDYFGQRDDERMGLARPNGQRPN